MQGQVVAELDWRMSSAGRREQVQTLMGYSLASCPVVCKTGSGPPQRQLHIPFVLFSLVPLDLDFGQLPPLPLFSWLLWLFYLA